MLEICVLGTGAMMPLPERKLAAVLLRHEGRVTLIDCGEGTQVAVRQSGFSMAKIDHILITHFHADHMAGLPGLLLTMGTQGRVAPVRLIGPKGLEPVVRCLRVIAPQLPFGLTFEEMDGPAHRFPLGGARLTGFALNHVIPCYGYLVELDRPGRFDPERARALSIPVPLWRALQQGQQVGGFTPDMVLGAQRPGLKFCYATDTGRCDAIARYGRDADLMILEGTYGQEDMAGKAALYGHMTFGQSAALARQAGAKRLLLTHFSPSMADPAALWPADQLACDGMRIDLKFAQG